MNKTPLILLAVIFNYASFAQTGREVSGVVKDSIGERVIAATVKLITAKDTLFTRTDMDGIFTFKAVKSSGFLITVSGLGYQTLNKRYLYNEGVTPLKLDTVILKSQNNVLNEVVVSGRPAITIKEDTVEYRASDYKLRENSLAEDLLKKLPGVEVDKDGNVTAQGKSVTKIRVNGKDFFGGDVKTATQQLPADIIDKIQLVDDYGDQANLTGIKNGDPDKILNIQISPDKNKGYFVRGSIGAGDKERYQASLTANSYKNTQQISFIGNLNNTNSSVFNFNGGGNAGADRQRGGGRRNQSGAANDPDGLTGIGSTGFNYRDDWSKKVISYGTYNFSNRDNTITSSSIEQNNSLTKNDNSTSNTLTVNHRFNWNMEYRPDSLNYMKFSPSFSYSKTDAGGLSNYAQLLNSQLSSDGYVLNNNKSEAPNAGGNVLLNHRFTKPGRNISLNLSLTNSKTTQNNDALNQYTNYTDQGNNTVYQNQQLDIVNRSTNTGATLSYNEPLSRMANLEFNYAYNYTKYKNERETFDIDQQNISAQNPALSTDYDYSFTTNRIGLTYRFTAKRYNYSLGASVQPAVLDGNAIIAGIETPYRNTGFNFVPVARYAYNFSKTRSFNAYYSGRSNEPSYSQLQPIPDLSNPQYPVYGNPDLRAEFNHTLNLRYNNFEPNTGNVLFANISASFTENKIVSNTIPKLNPTLGLVQENRFLNTDGYYTISSFYTYSKPFSERKYVFSLNGSANYNNNVSFNNNLKNNGRNTVLSQGLNVQLNPNKSLEINPGINYSYNINSNDLVSNANTEVSAWKFNFNSKVYFLKTWLIGAGLSKTMNNGYSSSLAVDPLILNTWLEKQFFKGKTGTLRLQAYDLFDQNTSVTNTVNATTASIVQSQNNKLSRYFLLSFTLRLQKFTGVQQQPQMPGRGGDRMNKRREGNGF